MPRKRNTIETDSDDDNDSDSDYELETEKRKRPPGKKAKKTKAQAVAELRASVVNLATNEDLSLTAADRLKGIDQGVLSRIKKALSLGSHDGTGEAEAKQAMRIASQLMAQHNVSLADILASEKNSEKLKRAGQSSVEIKSTKGKIVRIYSWMSTLAGTMRLAFDWLSELTVAAAYGFEMAFNLIMEWSGNKNHKLIYRSGVAQGLYDFTYKERKNEIRRVQYKEKALLEQARAEEEEEDRRRLARLEYPQEQGETPKRPTHKKGVQVEDVTDEDVNAVGPTEGKESLNAPTTFFTYTFKPANTERDTDLEDEWWQCEGLSESDADFRVDSADGNEFIDDEKAEQVLQEIETKNKEEKEAERIPQKKDDEEKKPPQKESKKEDTPEQTPWVSEQQLMLFKENANKIADDYIKENKDKIKLYADRCRTKPQLKTKEQRETYEQGKKDSKNIDLKRKKIKEFGEG